MWHTDPHARSLRLTAGVAAAVAFAAIAPAYASTASPSAPVGLSAELSSEEITLGETVSVTGRLGADVVAPPGIALSLQVDPYPYGSFSTIARTVSAQGGGFSFAGLRPDRNTRFRVISGGVPSLASPLLEATVDPKTLGSARSLGPGRVRLTLRVRHAVIGDERGVTVRWFLAARRSDVFRLAASTLSRELAPGVTYASVIVDPPVKRFVWRACINPPWEPAMGSRASHRRCPEATFVVRRDAR
jgi:hypothetical protein